MSTESSRTITKREHERLSERTGGTVEESLGRIESLLAMRSLPISQGLRGGSLTAERGHFGWQQADGLRGWRRRAEFRSSV